MIRGFRSQEKGSGLLNRRYSDIMRISAKTTESSIFIIIYIIENYGKLQMIKEEQ